MSVGIRVIKNSSLLLIFQILGRLLAFLTLPLLVRGLGQTMFGEFSTANAVVAMVAVFASLGLDPCVIRQIAQTPENASRLLFDSTVLKAGAALVAIGLSVIVGRLMGISLQSMQALTLLSAALFFSGILHSAAAYFYGQERMAEGALLGLGLNVANLVFIFWAFQQRWGIEAFAGAYLLASAILALICLVLLLPHYRDGAARAWSWQEKMQLIREALPFMMLSLALIVYYKVDVLILSRLSGSNSVGIYSASYRVLDSLMFLPAALMGALYPALSNLYVSKKSDLRPILEKGVRYLALIGIPAAAGVSVLSGDIVQLLYGSGWELSAYNLRLLIWAWGLIFLNAICPVTLNAIGRTMVNMFIVVGAILINISLNLILIPLMSTIGASLSTVATELVITLVYFIVVMHHVGKFSVLPHLMRPLAGSAIMYVVIHVFHLSNLEFALPWTILFSVLIGVVIYGGFMLISSGLRHGDWLLAKDVVLHTVSRVNKDKSVVSTDSK